MPIKQGSQNKRPTKKTTTQERSMRSQSSTKAASVNAKASSLRGRIPGAGGSGASGASGSGKR